MMHEQEEYYNFLAFLFSLVSLSLPPGLFPHCFQQLQLSTLWEVVWISSFPRNIT